MSEGMLAIYGPRAGKIHRPRNEHGYLHQADQTTAECACGSRMREVYRAEPVGKWLATPWLLCARCWPTPTDLSGGRA